MRNAPSVNQALTIAFAYAVLEWLEHTDQHGDDLWSVELRQRADKLQAACEGLS